MARRFHALQIVGAAIATAFDDAFRDLLSDRMHERLAFLGTPEDGDRCPDLLQEPPHR